MNNPASGGKKSHTGLIIGIVVVIIVIVLFFMYGLPAIQNQGAYSTPAANTSNNVNLPSTGTAPTGGSTGGSSPAPAPSMPSTGGGY